MSGPVARTALPSPVRLGLARGGCELRQFFRDPMQAVFTFALPTILLALLGSVFGDEIEGSGLSASQVFAAGMIAYGVTSASFVNVGQGVAADREDGTLKRLRGTPLPALSYLLGKVVLVAVVTVAEIALMLAVAVALFDVELPGEAGRWLTMLWVLALGLASCTLLGIALSALARSATSAAAIMQLPFLSLSFISGVFVTPVSGLPRGLVDFASFFPIKWMAQGFRSVFLPDRAASLEITGSWQHPMIALVLGAWCVAGLVLCLATFRWTTRGDG